MQNTIEIKEQRIQLKKRALDIIDGCKKEIRGLTEDETNELEDIKSKLNELQERLDELSNPMDDTNVESKEAITEPTDEPQVDESNDIPTEEPKEEEQVVEPMKKDKEENKRNSNTNINKSNITMEKNFSLLKTIRSIANNQSVDTINRAVLNAGAEEMRKSGLNYVGQIQLPAEKREAITVEVEGEDVVATDIMDVVKPLQAMNVMVKAGAKYITGLVGDIQYPVMGNGACTWEGETSTAKNGEPVFKNIKLSPKRLTTVVAISKQFLLQDGVGAENAIREEIINAINAKLESTILGNEEGTATQPAGIFAREALASISDFKSLCDLEAELEDANVYGDLKYILSPKAKAALRNMAKSAKSTQLVYENGEVDGTEALSTSHVKDKNIAFGDFSQYVIAQWGNLDITVDNVTLAADGKVRLVINAYFDAKPLRNEAIKVATLA